MWLLPVMCQAHLLGFPWGLVPPVCMSEECEAAEAVGGHTQHGHFLQPAGAPYVAACGDPICQNKPVCVV